MGLPAQQPTLGDLYVLESEPIEFTTNRGSMWVVVRKLDPLDMDDARRRAGAVRARTMAVKAQRDSDEYLSLLSQAFDADRSTATDLLIREEVAKRRISVEAELELGEGDKPGEPTKWGKDGYLQGLVDQWQTLQYAFPEPEHKDHEDAKRVFAELDEFSREVDERVDQHTANLRKKKDKLSDEEIAHEFAAFLVDVTADKAWARERDRCKVWMGTYVATPTDEGGFVVGGRCFPNTAAGREQVDRLDEAPLTRLIQAIEAIEVGVIEGKDSQPTTPSWLPSEPSDEAETAASSGLAAATT